MHDRIADFDAQDPGIRHVRAQNFMAGAVNTAAKSFDPEEISIRVLLGQSGKISAVTATQIHFERGRARKNLGERKRTKIVCRNKFDRRGSIRNPAISSHSFR